MRAYLLQIIIIFNKMTLYILIRLWIYCLKMWLLQYPIKCVIFENNDDKNEEKVISLAFKI
jgi:hypothetical protein